MRIAVIGGGPAGCRVSELLALQGHEVTLFDGLGPWEKPCGGGMTAKALALDPLIADSVPQCHVDRIRIHYGDRLSVTVAAPEALAILSRKELGQHMLLAAARAGVRFRKERVVQLSGRTSSWVLHTRHGSLQVNYIVGADGATSLVRRHLATPLGSDDLHVTVGYFVPGRPTSELTVYFVPQMEGYIWSFPRPDHLSYGLITRPTPRWADRYKALLWNYAVADLGETAMREAEFYSAPVPALPPGAWARNSVAGDGWALVGDAAGLVDPITGEGIYYALKSAEILAASFQERGRYVAALREECLPELERASRLYWRFYRGRFAGGDFRKRMVQLARRSPAVGGVLGDLIAGAQPYRGLRRRLARSIPRTVWQLAASGFRRSPL